MLSFQTNLPLHLFHYTIAPFLLSSHMVNKEGCYVNVYHKIVQHKMKSITANELMMYAKEYNVSLSQKDAETIIQMMREKTNRYV